MLIVSNLVLVLNNSIGTLSSMEIFFVFRGLNVSFDPILSFDGGRGCDESADHFCVLILYFPAFDTSI